MKLSLKLPLAFTVSLLLLFAAALFGISRLNQALDTYQTTVAQSFEHERMAAGMLNNFKVQVQEWKNVLLRGKDPAQLTRYWAAFEKQEQAIKDEAQKLVAALPPGEGANACCSLPRPTNAWAPPTARGWKPSRQPTTTRRRATRPWRAWTASPRSCWTKRAT